MENDQRIKAIENEIEAINREIFALRGRKARLYLERNSLISGFENNHTVLDRLCAGVLAKGFTYTAEPIREEPPPPPAKES